MKKLLTTSIAMLCLSTPPDILPEGMKGVVVETRFEAGALANDYSLSYTVKAGDTLSSIAKSKLGDEARWKEIVPLNPGLQPDKLQPNQSLWLPPQKAAAAGATQPEIVRAYFMSHHMKSETVQPLEPGAEVNVKRGEIGVYLVPASAFAAFEDARRQRLPGVRPMVAEGKVKLIEGRAPSHLVPRDDPTHKRTDTLRLEQDSAGKLVLMASSVSYDKNGKEIGKAGVSRDSKTPEPEKELVLLLLALAGGTWLVWRRRRSLPHVALA